MNLAPATNDHDRIAPHPPTDRPDSLNRWLLGAGAIAGFSALLHILSGGSEVAGPLVDSSLAEMPRLVLYAVWHMASIALVLSTGALVLGSLPRHRQPARYLVIFIGMLWVGFGLCFVAVALTRRGDNLFFSVLPQWTLLIPTGVLALLGANSDRSTSNARP